MTVRLPNDQDLWPSIVKILESVVHADAAYRSADLVKNTLQSIYSSFTGKDSSQKFADIPLMFGSLPEDVVRQFIKVTFPSLCADVAAWGVSPSWSDSLPFLAEGGASIARFSAVEAYLLLAQCFLCIPLVRGDGSFLVSETTCHLFFTNRPRICSKLSCLVNYFNVMVAAKSSKLFPAVSTEALLGRSIELERLVAPKLRGAEWWCSQTDIGLCGVEVREKFERIETAHDALQADFANKHIGGGVLRRGCVQEEIRFMISPECLLAVMLTDPLAENEAVVIRNTVQFCDYSGYSQSFKCRGLSREMLSLLDGRASHTLASDTVVCIDAIPFGLETHMQFHVPLIVRELEKCRVGLSGGDHASFATGNWGCGAFGGDTQLKAVVQWLACSVSRRQLIFFPFDDSNTENFPDLVLAAAGMSVGQVFALIVEGSDSQLSSKGTINYLLERIRNIDR